MQLDNRFLPWYPHVTMRTLQKRSHINIEGFFITGDSVYGDLTTKKRGIPELWGLFDQAKLSQAAALVGQTNYLQPKWQTAREIKWDVFGKIQGQGAALKAEHGLNKWFSVGGSTRVMHLTSNQKFVLPKDTINSADLNLTPADEIEIDQDRRDTLKDLGFTQSEWSYSGFTDSELHARFCWSQDYTLKCRQIDLGFLCGMLFPSSKQRETKNPAAIPLGGQNLWGLYWGLDWNFELKEDLWFGMMLNLSHRLSKVQTRRLPVKGEPQVFGATEGEVKIDPGVTVMFSPSVVFSDIQDGFGLGLQYVYTHHASDTWTDKRADTSITLDFSNIRRDTKWTSEYLFFNLFYDFGKVAKEGKFNPVVSFSWDIPANILNSKNFAKTQRVGLSFELRF